MTFLDSTNVRSLGSDGPLVSIIMPTHNRPATLREALQSIAAQTYRNIETIVVNDGGLDVSFVISDFTPKCNIQYITHPVRKGPAASRNTALKASRGQYVAYLDDDDLYYSDHIERLVNFLQLNNHHIAYADAYRAHQQKRSGFRFEFWVLRHESSNALGCLYALSTIMPRHVARLLYSLWQVLSRNGGRRCGALASAGIDMFRRCNADYIVTKWDLPYSFDFDPDRILVRNYIPILCLIHKKSCLDEVGLFDESLRTHEDWELWIRLSRKYKFAHLRQPTCEYARRSDGTNTTSAIRHDFARTTEIIYARFRDLARDKNDVQEAQTRCLQLLRDELEERALHPSIQSQLYQMENR